MQTLVSCLTHSPSPSNTDLPCQSAPSTPTVQPSICHAKSNPPLYPPKSQYHTKHPSLPNPSPRPIHPPIAKSHSHAPLPPQLLQMLQNRHVRIHEPIHAVRRTALLPTIQVPGRDSTRHALAPADVRQSVDRFYYPVSSAGRTCVRRLSHKRRRKQRGREGRRGGGEEGGAYIVGCAPFAIR